MSFKQRQEAELLAMQNIYPEHFIIKIGDVPSGQCTIHVRTSENFYLKNNLINSKIKKPTEPAVYSIQHLPPVTLIFELQYGYPTHAYPVFALCCDWLTFEQLSQVCRKLSKLWLEKRSECLYTWYQFIESELLTFLGLSNYLDISELSHFKMTSDYLPATHVFQPIIEWLLAEKPGSDHLIQNIKPTLLGGGDPIDNRSCCTTSDGRTLLQHLKNYDIAVKDEKFRLAKHDCEVCFIETDGREFARFIPCRHPVCIACLKSMFELQIKDGVSGLRCPFPGCSSEADGTLVKEIVNEDLYTKFEKLSLQKALSSMSDIVYCPGIACDIAVIADFKGKLAMCSNCGLSFCPFCKKAYHGIEPCSFMLSEHKTIFHQYTNGDKNAKDALVKKYGRKKIDKIIADMLSEDWKSNNSKPCPHCRSNVEKIDGCHRMFCRNCENNFCWLCLRKLPNANPYDHFNDPAEKCFDRLFPPEYLADDDDAEEAEQWEELVE